MQAEDNVTDDVKEVRTLCLDNIPWDQQKFGDWILVFESSMDIGPAQIDSLVVTESLLESSWNYDSGVWCSSLKEVVGSSASHMRFPPPGGRVKLEEGVLQGVIQLHNRSLVSTAVAVVGC